jgi:hypothetical protein
MATTLSQHSPKPSYAGPRYALRNEGQVLALNLLLCKGSTQAALA